MGVLERIRAIIDEMNEFESWAMASGRLDDITLSMLAANIVTINKLEAIIDEFEMIVGGDRR